MPEELTERVYKAKQDISAADALIKDYLPFIKSETSKALGNKAVNEGDDQLSIAMLAFFEAISSYSRVKGSFIKYAALIIKRKLIDHYRKEKKHEGNISMDSKINEDTDSTIEDSIQDDEDAYEKVDVSAAVKQELAELLSQLKEFSISFNEVVEHCPKRSKTLESCQKVIAHARKNPDMVQEMKAKKRVPISAFALGTGVEKKTLERHRNYIIALLLIVSNGYDLIRAHLNEVFAATVGGNS